jgi:hypothetical protein
LFGEGQGSAQSGVRRGFRGDLRALGAEQVAPGLRGGEQRLGRVVRGDGAIPRRRYLGDQIRAPAREHLQGVHRGEIALLVGAGHESGQRSQRTLLVFGGGQMRQLVASSFKRGFRLQRGSGGDVGLHLREANLSLRHVVSLGERSGLVSQRIKLRGDSGHSRCRRRGRGCGCLRDDKPTQRRDDSNQAAGPAASAS